MNFKRTLISVVTCLLLVSNVAAQEEVSLYDSKGNAVAYIADDSTIYLWDGDPVAYLSKSKDDVNIYGFNGKHLGWLEDGIIIDHKGYGVGFVKGAVEMITAIEPIKGIKSIKPIKSIKEIAPIKSISLDKWSRTPLKVFLGLGIDD